jgi:hypothetical protein
MFVMEPEKGKKLLESVSSVRALWILGEPQEMKLATWQWLEPVSLSASVRRPAAPASPPSPARTKEAPRRLQP